MSESSIEKINEPIINTNNSVPLQLEPQPVDTSSHIHHNTTHSSMKMFGFEFTPSPRCGWVFVKYIFIFIACFCIASTVIRWVKFAPLKIGPGRPPINPHAPPASPMTPLVALGVSLLLLVGVEGGVCNTWVLLE